MGFIARACSWMTIIWLVSYTAQHKRRWCLSFGRRYRLGPDASHDSLVAGGPPQDRSRHVLALLRIAPGLQYGGPSTPWPEEVWQKFAEFQEPLDGFTLAVEQVFRLHTPLITFEALDQHGGGNLKSTASTADLLASLSHGQHVGRARVVGIDWHG